jgi:hypothetical protein
VVEKENAVVFCLGVGALYAVQNPNATAYEIDLTVQLCLFRLGF